MTEPELVEAIKRTVTELNTLFNEASLMSIKVNLEQFELHTIGRAVSTKTVDVALLKRLY